MLLFPASTDFIITIGVQKQNVFGFFLDFCLSFKISCLFSFPLQFTQHSAFWKTHVVSIIYGACMNQGENRPYYIVSFLCGIEHLVFLMASPLTSYLGTLFIVRESHFIYDTQMWTLSRWPPVFPHGQNMGLSSPM